ncbi:MAG: transcriptional regulator [Thermodesulfobacteriota bacterium]|nr:transcriptional regulator [Thermodesulfobacteriota bacterium]
MAKRVLKLGIISRENYKKRTIAIARGEYKPKKGEPKVWFESVQSMAQILSSENQELLRIIKEQEPASLKELELVSGRKRSNLSRTLNTMSRYGIVDLVKRKRTVKPIVKATDFKVEFGLNITVTGKTERDNNRLP